MTRGEDSTPKRIAKIEGITEYRLENGAQVLLFPDDSKSIVTVNMTVFVGSRHEGYGEAGMAHLLEHMLFKGTPSNPTIPTELKNRGANFNGTTWLDRTNYYESLPASNPDQARDNLEYAIRLEADRLVNSFVKGEDLISEMTVVRNEFEQGENNPLRILMQRVQAAAYEWHNYGRSTIGNQSDIERVPIDRLQAFYRKFYRPDNMMLVVAGKFDPETALELISKYVGVLKSPDAPLDRTYTTEPPQDGERTVVLRRVGNTQHIMAAYHVPSGASREFAAVEMLAYVFGTEPSGRLYQDLVEPQLATEAFCSSFALHDPGQIMFGVQLPISKSIESARQALLQSVENVAEKPITVAELNRAKTQFFKERELRATNATRIAVELSEWAAQGDWRLYFLFRDYVEQVTPEECTAAAAHFLNRNNRTLGLFIPSETSERVQMPTKPDLQKLLADYEGRAEIQQGEEFDPDPLAIEARTERGALKSGIKTAWLPKRTTGGSVQISINLRYGNEQSLKPFLPEIDFLPEMLMRGTRDLDYEQLQDRLDELRARVRTSGTTGLLSVSIETTREYLDEVLPLVGEILRQPRFDPDELEVMRRQDIAAMEAQLTEPQPLASVLLQRTLSPYDKENIRYIPTLEEQLDIYRKASIEKIVELYRTQLNGDHGEITAVGDFDPATLTTASEAIFADWHSSVEFARIPSPAITDVAGQIMEIETPDKANAVYLSGLQIALRDDDANYPGLLVGNDILGGGGLSSRLGNRVRQTEGLSYGVGTMLRSHPIDPRTTLMMFAITNPQNRDRLMDVVAEEVALLLDDGITAEELDAAKQGILQREQVRRAEDRSLCQMLAESIFANRDMLYYARLEQAVEALSVEDVNATIRKYIEPERLVIVTAGDFSKSDASSQ